MDELRSLVNRARASSYGNWIKFHGKCYSVCGIALEFVSEVFATHRAAERDSPFEIKSNVCEESVVEFLKPFQNEAYTLTTSIAYDVLTLWEEFSIGCFQQIVVDFISQDKQGAIIGGIKRSLERRSVSPLLEANLREHFFELIDNDQLFELPVNYLHRIAALPPSATPDQIDTFVNFVIRSLGHYGPVM